MHEQVWQKPQGVKTPPACREFSDGPPGQAGTVPFHSMCMCRLDTGKSCSVGQYYFITSVGHIGGKSIPAAYVEDGHYIELHGRSLWLHCSSPTSLKHLSSVGLRKSLQELCSALVSEVTCSNLSLIADKSCKMRPE